MNNMQCKIKFLIKIKISLNAKHGSSKFSFAIIYNGETFGVWNDYHEGKIFVSTDYDKFSPYLFSMTLKDHSLNTTLSITLETPVT